MIRINGEWERENRRKKRSEKVKILVNGLETLVNVGKENWAERNNFSYLPIRIRLHWLERLIISLMTCKLFLKMMMEREKKIREKKTNRTAEQFMIQILKRSDSIELKTSRIKQKQIHQEIKWIFEIEYQ